MRKLAGFAILSVLVTACSTQAPAPEQQVQATLAAPANCATAAEDIAILSGEKARVSQEIEDGASAIMPVGALAHMFRGSEAQALEIGTGEYNGKLDAKIAEIRQQCNIQ
ncbi:MAG: hypothetical protein ACRCVD_14905 [Halioglobus sp.]